MSLNSEVPSRRVVLSRCTILEKKEELSEPHLSHVNLHPVESGKPCVRCDYVSTRKERTKIHEFIQECVRAKYAFH